MPTTLPHARPDCVPHAHRGPGCGHQRNVKLHVTLLKGSFREAPRNTVRGELNLGGAAAMEAMMRIGVTTILTGTPLAGAAALAFAAATPATAEGGDAQTVLVQLPNGQIEQVDDAGPLAPQVMMATPAEMRAQALGMNPAFAAFQQMAAMMDQQAATMLQQVAQTPMMSAAMPNLPPGVSGYSVVTTISNGRACTRSTEIRYDGNGLQPRTVSNLSGDCGAGPDQPATPAELPPAAAPATRPHTIRVRYTRPALARPLVHEAFYQAAPSAAN